MIRFVPTTGPQWVCEQARTTRSRSRPWPRLERVADAVERSRADPADVERDEQRPSCRPGPRAPAPWPRGHARPPPRAGRGRRSRPSRSAASGVIAARAVPAFQPCRAAEPATASRTRPVRRSRDQHRSRCAPVRGASVLPRTDQRIRCTPLVRPVRHLQPVVTSASDGVGQWHRSHEAGDDARCTAGRRPG